MVLGLGLALAELALPSFFIIWFALGALIVGVVLLIAPAMGFAAQVLLWTIASILMTVLWFKFFRNAGKTRFGQADAVLGEVGVLVRSIEPMEALAGHAANNPSGRGEVRFQKPLMGADTWPCLANEAIAAGTRVKVLGVDGQFLKVGRIALTTAANPNAGKT